MERHFIHEIEDLKKSLLKMVSVVDEQVELAYNGILTGDIGDWQSVKDKDKTVDAFDNEIKEQSKKILALYQPVASDLRFVFTAIMITNQLERCGDIAVNIANRIRKTVDYHETILGTDLIEMIKIARFMVKDAIDSFLHEDNALANSVLHRDSEVDRLNKVSFDYLVQKMETDSSFVRAGAHLLIMAKHIERLADHATNIAEDVIFLVNDEIVSHTMRKKK
jgi:phosphate transport system protein